MSVEFLCSRTKMMPVADLKPHPMNPWKHGKKQIAMLRRYIELDGWRHPIILDKKTRVIAGGHLRHLVALDMGLTEVPVDIQYFKTPARLMAFLKADNEIGALRQLDPEKDALLIGEIAKIENDFNLALEGIGDFRLETAGLAEGASAALPMGNIPVRTKPNEIWLLGNHVLGVCDATDAAAVRTVFQAAGAEPVLMVTDPPYGIGFEYNSYDDSSAEQTLDLVRKVFAYAPAGRIWTPGLANIKNHLQEFGPAKVLCWNKKFAQAGNGLGGASTWEPILVIDPPVKALDNDVMEVPTDRLQVDGQKLKDLHPCPKPLTLWQMLLAAFTKPNMLIYDPFCGSGTTLIACEQSGRRCAALEIDPRYADVIIYRWEKLSGRKAERANAK